jgi:2-hydroxychromene-2-carboxylate isomerase
MQFRGQVWFDFSSPSVWVFYRWVRALAESGVDVALDWMPLPADAEREAMATLLGIEDSQDRGRFLHAMLGLVHIDKRSASEMETVAEALRAAGLDSMIVRDEHPLLKDLATRSTELGIDAVPTLCRHGPVLSVQLNDSVFDGDVQQVARTINEVMESDGIWELRKP